MPFDRLGGVERDLASLCKTLEQHQGPTDAEALTASELLELRLDGPQTESDLFTQVSLPASNSGPLPVAGTGSLEFTDYSRACAQLWVDVFGRRFALYKNLALQITLTVCECLIIQVRNIIKDTLAFIYPWPCCIPRTRTDVGVKRGPRKGTFAAILERQRQSVKELVNTDVVARANTFLGFDRKL